MKQLYEAHNPLIFNSEEEYQSKLKQYILESEIKLSEKDTRKKLLQIRDRLIDPSEKEFLNFIIGNSRYHKKIVFVTDGSYRNHRIWKKSRKDYMCLLYFDKFYEISSNLQKAKEDMKNIMNSFEKIFIQISID